MADANSENPEGVSPSMASAALAGEEMAGAAGQAGPAGQAGTQTELQAGAAPFSPDMMGKRNPPSVVAMIQSNKLVFGIIGLVLGCFLLVVSTAVLTNASGQVRVVFAIVGIASAYLGLDLIFKFIWGANFETGLWLAGFWLVVVCLAAIFADFLPLSEARNASVTIIKGTETLLRPDILSQHPFGTDRQALDVLGGVVYGARVSLQVSLGAVAIGITVGGVIGVIAGFFQKKLDAVIGVMTDAILAFPPLILLLALATVLQPSPRNMALALAMLGIPTYIRLSRANTLVFAQREFVLAAKSMGATRSRIIFRELVPNVALPLVSYAFIIVAVLIVAEASLSFLGLGIQRPEPTWGNMIAAGQDDFERHPHIVFIPGIVMFLTVFSLNRVGEKARQIWDPRVSNL